MVDIPTPDSFPFDVCTPSPSGELVCVKTGDIVFDDPRDCNSAPGGQTPPLYSADWTYTEESIEIIGDNEILVSIDFWAGVESDLSAVWIGEETSEQCARYPISVDPVASTVDDVIDDINGVAVDVVEWIEENLGGPAPQSTQGEILKGIILIGLAIIILIIPGPQPY